MDNFAKIEAQASLWPRNRTQMLFIYVFCSLSFLFKPQTHIHCYEYGLDTYFASVVGLKVSLNVAKIYIKFV